MKKTLLKALPFLTLCFFACKNPPPNIVLPGEDPRLLDSAVSQKQFSDLPVPARFEVQEESFGSQVGSFRSGRLVYHGPLPPTDVEEYFKARLPEHGWQVLGRSWSEKGKVHMSFQKQDNRAEIQLWQEAAQPEKTSQGYQPASGNRRNLITKILILVSTKKNT